MGCCCGCCCRVYDKCCCGCFGIQTGAKIILILSLIFEIVLLINDVSTDFNLSDRLTIQFFNDPRRFVSGEINPVLVSSVILSLIWIALDVFAIFGIFLKKPGFLVGWLIVHMIALVLFTIASFVMAFMTLFFTGALIELFTCSTGDYGSGCIRDTPVSPYDTGVAVVVGSLFIGFLVALNWIGYYFWDIVRSAKVELEQEDGRARAFELGNQNSQQMLYPTQQIIVQVPPTQQGFVQPPQYKV